MQTVQVTELLIELLARLCVAALSSCDLARACGQLWYTADHGPAGATELSAGCALTRAVRSDWSSAIWNPQQLLKVFWFSMRIIESYSSISTILHFHHPAPPPPSQSGTGSTEYMVFFSEGGKEAVIKSGCVKTLLKLFVNTNIEDMDEILLGLLSSLASDSGTQALLYFTFSTQSSLLPLKSVILSSCRLWLPIHSHLDFPDPSSFP